MTNATQQKQNDKRPLILAGVLGLVAAVLVVMFLSRADEKPPVVDNSPTMVAVATQDLAPGVRINADMVELREIPTSAMVAGGYRAKDGVVGKTVRYPVAKGEQLTVTRLVEPQKSQTISFVIPKGLRAITIPVSTIGLLIAPGDFVDILISVDSATVLAGNRPGVTANQNAIGTIVQNVQVLSVGLNFVNEGVPYDPSVRGTAAGGDFFTVAVTPEQAQLLLLAQQEGAISLTLRPFGDEQIVQLSPRQEPLIQP
jgi:pilus assembly protein CpaB